MVTLPTIALGPKQFAPGTIFLKKPKSKLQKFLELQPKILPVLAGITASIVPGGGLIRGAKVFLGTGLVSGILAASPLARKVAREKILDPTKIGIGIGGIIEDPSKLVPDIPKGETLGEKIKETFVGAGLIGAGAAALVGAAALLTKKIKSLKPGVPGLPGLPGLPGAPGVSLPAMAPVISQPLGPAKKPEPEKPLEEIKPVAVMPTIRNVFKPRIDIRFSKKRTFINQQLLIR